jgi:anthranilate/para-aminobenzoate synthase component II
MAGRFERGLTYQFHPESIGTDNPELFFEPLKKILTK